MIDDGARFGVKPSPFERELDYSTLSAHSLSPWLSQPVSRQKIKFKQKEKIQTDTSVNFVKLNLKMASLILGAKKFPGIRGVHKSGGHSVPPKNSITFELSRKSPRCAHCLKFLAEDPTAKIGEDEVEKLYSCS